ncbi:MAG: N-acetylmuramidase domain-containing protein [Bacteroidia bacterium]
MRKLIYYSLLGLELIFLACIGYVAFFVKEGTELTSDLTLNPFHKIALIIVLAWIAILLAYYGWAIYFYNLNFGRSDEFWSNFLKKQKEFSADPSKDVEAVYDLLHAPKENPYGDETFGLPPGTVRGTLALTILIGGLALFVSFFGSERLFTVEEGSIIHDYFDFFKEAFLMVVAFYFGTKALGILQQERTKRHEKNVELAKASPKKSSGGSSTELSKFPDEGETGMDTPAAPVSTPPSSETTAPAATPTSAPTPSGAKLPVHTVSLPGKLIHDNIKKFYPHVEDLEKDKDLDENDIRKFAESTGLELAVVKAVIEVESSGSGFLKDGRPKILFEGHVFWKQLKKAGVDPAPLAAANPDIIYQNWTRQHYLTGTKEHGRLEKAKKIHEEAALQSASWGLFQVMGYHWENLQYDSIHEFVAKHQESEYWHLDGFGRFIEKNNLVQYLKAKNWADFALRYNGKGYAVNKYDTKLAAAYAKHSQAEEKIV